LSLTAQITSAQQTFATLASQLGTLEELSGALIASLKGGNKLLACGNGGSAAQAHHLVTELVGRYKFNRRSLPALYLGGEASMITCIANDFAWEEIFSRPLRSLGAKGDIVACFSTSGNSPNVLRTLEAARELGLKSFALLGKGGGPAKGLATWEVIVDSKETARVQEAHLFLVHWLCERIEEAFPA
jgi:D-sedoheptulose 7-phosphate isomerase